MGDHLHRRDRNEVLQGAPVVVCRPRRPTHGEQDLLVDPSTRNVKDVSHKITAIGSRSVASAQKFLDMLKSNPDSDACSWGPKNGGLDGCKPYGSYEEVYADPLCRMDT